MLERHIKSKDRNYNGPSLDFRKAASLWKVLSENKKKNQGVLESDNNTNNNNNNNNNTTAPKSNFNTWNRSKESPFNSSVGSSISNTQANTTTLKKKPELDKSKDDSLDNFFKVRLCCNLSYNISM